MKKSLITLSAVLTALFTSQAVLAADPPKTREEVKAEAKAANKDGTTAKGEAGPTAATGKSTKARTDVKDEAKMANKAGTTAKGEAGAAAPAGKSVKARADVKDEAKMANKAGTISKGEETAVKK